MPAHKLTEHIEQTYHHQFEQKLFELAYELDLTQECTSHQVVSDLKPLVKIERKYLKYIVK